MYININANLGRKLINCIKSAYLLKTYPLLKNRPYKGNNWTPGNERLQRVICKANDSLYR